MGGSLRIETWGLLLRGSARRRRFVRPTDERLLAVEISQNMASFIQKENSGVLAGEFADDGSGPVPGRHRHRDNPIMAELPHLRESGALNLCAKELTKRRRTRRVRQWAGQQMEPCGFRLAGNEQPMRFAWHANVEEQEAISGLVYFLNPPLN